MKYVLGSLFFLSAVILPARQALAQQETTISVSPSILELAVKPGESAQMELTIRNGGELGLPISTQPQSLLQDDDILIEKDQELSDASTWIRISGPDFLLGPKEVKKLPLYVTVPINATPGGHYAQISIRGLSLESVAGNGTSIVVPEVSVTVLISVSGAVTNDMYIERGSILPFFVRPRTDLFTNFTIVNKGNNHDLVSPELVVRKNNVEIYRQRLSNRVILPQTKKQFNELVQLPDDYGLYETFIEFSYANGQKVYQSKQEKVLVSRSPLTIIIFGVITFIGLYLFQHRRNIKLAWLVIRGKDR